MHFLRIHDIVLNFANDTCLIQDKLNLITIRKADIIERLYLLYIQLEKLKCSIKHSAFVCKASTNVWHQWLGHPLIAQLKDLSHV